MYSFNIYTRKGTVSGSVSGSVSDVHSIILHYITLSSFHTPYTPKVTSGASTKLSMSGIVSECKHMSFQLLFEQTVVGKFLETKRKFIPSLGSFFRRTFASITEARIEECLQI